MDIHCKYLTILFFNDTSIIKLKKLKNKIRWGWLHNSVIIWKTMNCTFLKSLILWQWTTPNNATWIKGILIGWKISILKRHLGNNTGDAFLQTGNSITHRTVSFSWPHLLALNQYILLSLLTRKFILSYKYQFLE